MSRATTSGPVSESRVLTGCLLSSARISGIGRLRSILTAAPLPVPDTPSVAASSSASVVAGRYCPGLNSSCSRNTPSGVILALA